MPRPSFAQHIQALILRLLPDGFKGIVFTRSRSEADAMAKELDCDSFHSGKTGAQLGEALARWERGRVKIIVATTLLGTGYHTDNVRLTVCVGAPYNYIAYSQATGRGGRNETYAEAHTLLDSVEAAMGAPARDEFGSALLMQHLTNPSICLREGMETFLDGHGQPCSTQPYNHVPCARCDPDYIPPPPGEPPALRAPPPPRPRPEPTASEFSTQLHVDYDVLLNARVAQLDYQHRLQTDEQLKIILDCLRVICINCWLQSRAQITTHTSQTCPHRLNYYYATVNTSSGPQQLATLKARLNFAGTSVCRWCWCPRGVILHARQASTEQDCIYRTVIPDVLFGFFMFHRQVLASDPSFDTITFSSTFDQYWASLKDVLVQTHRPFAITVFIRACDHLFTLH
ncbi:P-loop containing nucleoside triphosphate hydrolase protein [Exidia glandulosa HHB12029]|uniref:DNA 3'-5' helicase n=1 Tax=Exidia glandulosa HHB12029 TaxID=1314781 RepID=A0A166MF62_EXIGL|nr:P-loop containing nucleoside triphosphate hydrolase protein [Exidia glandulosa HHB12029]